jgi:hypothetical protein
MLRIANEGLEPRVSDENAHMTGGVPVVWLTRQSDNIITAADFEHITQRLKALGETPDPRWQIGGRHFGGAARLTVEIARHDKRLMRFPDFARKRGLQIAFKFSPPSLDMGEWFIYRGHVPAHKVSTILPREQMLALLDWHISTHPDSEAVKVFKTMGEHVAKSNAAFWDLERGECGGFAGLISYQDVA